MTNHKNSVFYYTIDKTDGHLSIAVNSVNFDCILLTAVPKFNLSSPCASNCSCNMRGKRYVSVVLLTHISFSGLHRYYYNNYNVYFLTTICIFL